MAMDRTVRVAVVGEGSLARRFAAAAAAAEAVVLVPAPTAEAVILVDAALAPCARSGFIPSAPTSTSPAEMAASIER